MSQPIPSQAQDRHAKTSYFASFVLRCWRDSRGQIRARLVDVHTGISYPLADLDELPDLIRRLLAITLVDSASIEPRPTDEVHSSQSPGTVIES